MVLTPTAYISCLIDGFLFIRSNQIPLFTRGLVVVVVVVVVVVFLHPQ